MYVAVKAFCTCFAADFIALLLSARAKNPDAKAIIALFFPITTIGMWAVSVQPVWALLRRLRKIKRKGWTTVLWLLLWMYIMLAVAAMVGEFAFVALDFSDPQRKKGVNKYQLSRVVAEISFATLVCSLAECRMNDTKKAELMEMIRKAIHEQPPPLEDPDQKPKNDCWSCLDAFVIDCNLCYACCEENCLDLAGEQANNTKCSNCCASTCCGGSNNKCSAWFKNKCSNCCASICCGGSNNKCSAWFKNSKKCCSSGDNPDNTNRPPPAGSGSGSGIEMQPTGTGMVSGKKNGKEVAQDSATVGIVENRGKIERKWYKVSCFGGSSSSGDKSEQKKPKEKTADDAVNPHKTTTTSGEGGSNPDSL